MVYDSILADSGWFPARLPKAYLLMVVYKLQLPPQKKTKSQGLALNFEPPCVSAQYCWSFSARVGYTFKHTVLALLPKRTQDAPPTPQYGLYG